MNPLIVEWIGRTEYETAWNLQKQTVQRLAKNPDEPDRLLLLEHPPTYTFGRRASLDNLLFSEQQLADEGITTHWVDRGGDVTYHGPGQLVGYPIINLRRLQNRPQPDLHRYLRDLEQTIIDTLATFDVSAWRYPGYTGVWVDQIAQASGVSEPHKMAAIGIKVSGDGISSHGFALNVNINMAHFAGIIPCGIEEHPVTSLDRYLDTSIAVDTVIPQFIAAFQETFGFTNIVTTR